METKLSGKKFPKFGYTSRGCLFLGNFVKCCSIRYLKLPIIQTGRFGRGMESTQDVLSDVPLLPEANRRIVFHLLSHWIFRELFVNGKQPTTLHVNHTFRYILLPSSAELRCEIPNVVLKQGVNR